MKQELTPEHRTALVEYRLERAYHNYNKLLLFHIFSISTVTLSLIAYNTMNINMYLL